MENPIDGIIPDFSIFGAEFTELWQKLFAGIWGISILVAIVFLILGLVQMANAQNASNPAAFQPAKKQALWAGIALGALVALAVIVGAIISVFG